jgi:hypothetical protein
MQDLPHLSELHKLHYARYSQIEARPVALIGQFDDMTDNLLADVAATIGSWAKVIDANSKMREKVAMALKGKRVDH